MRPRWRQDRCGPQTLHRGSPVAFKDLNIDPKLTDELRGDVGVIFADETGESRSLRLTTTTTQIVDDLLSPKRTLSSPTIGARSSCLSVRIFSTIGALRTPSQRRRKTWIKVGSSARLLTETKPRRAHGSSLQRSPVAVAQSISAGSISCRGLQQSRLRGFHETY